MTAVYSRGNPGLWSEPTSTDRLASDAADRLLTRYAFASERTFAAY